jgi:hypothetical protein
VHRKDFRLVDEDHEAGILGAMPGVPFEEDRGGGRDHCGAEGGDGGGRRVVDPDVEEGLVWSKEEGRGVGEGGGRTRRRRKTENEIWEMENEQ